MFNHFITKISPFLRSTSLHFAVRSPKYCLRIFNWVPLSFFIYMDFPIYSEYHITFSYYKLWTILAQLKFFWLLICYLDINECARSPCKNGASCLNIPGSYQCKCKSGYTGRNCQTGELCVRLNNFIRYTNFHLAFIWIFLVISLSCMIIIINSFLLLFFMVCTVTNEKNVTMW